MASKSKQLWSCSGPYFTARGFITNCRLLLMTLPENRCIVGNDKIYGLYHLKYKTNLQLRFSTFHGSTCSNVLQESKINWTLIIIIMIWMWPFFPLFSSFKVSQELHMPHQWSLWRLCSGFTVYAVFANLLKGWDATTTLESWKDSKYGGFPPGMRSPRLTS